MASAPVTRFLPEDIVEDILARLPVKSLKRFRCVGKSLCSLIQSPQFIYAHYSFSKNKVYPVVKHGQNYCPEKINNKISIISNQTFDIVANLDMPHFTDEDRYVYIRGYCNGIICLWSSDRSAVLWNIATKEFKTLPECPFESPPGYKSCTEILCLGFDSQKYYYKVIRIDRFWKENEDPMSMRDKRVALYNLSTDSWRKLNVNLSDVELGYDAKRAFYSNGFIHCLASVEKEKVKVFDEDVLLSIDTSREVFVTTPFPDGAKNRFFQLMEINGSASMIVKLRNYDCYEVWVLGEVGVKNSWIKLFTIGPVSKAQWPLGFGSDGKVFFKAMFSPNFLAWHHPSNREIKALDIPGSGFLEVVMYAESLVSLKGETAFHN